MLDGESSGMELVRITTVEPDPTRARLLILGQEDELPPYRAAVAEDEGIMMWLRHHDKY